MKKINAIIVSVTMLVAGLNFYFANCDAQSDFDLSMADVEKVAQGEDMHVGRTKKHEDPESFTCTMCYKINTVCLSDGGSRCTPVICADVWGKLVKEGKI